MKLSREVSKLLTLVGTFVLSSALLVTVVGYFDEGTYRAFDGFWSYLIGSGVPPVSDYILWAIIFIIVGFASFGILNLSGWVRQRFLLHSTLSTLAVPILFFGLLFVANL